jgi:hypothetical protein
MNTQEPLQQLRQYRWLLLGGAVLAAALGWVVLLLWAVAVILLGLAAYDEWLIYQGNKALRRT